LRSSEKPPEKTPFSGGSSFSPHAVALLRPRRERPSRRAAKPNDEFAPEDADDIIFQPRARIVGRSTKSDDFSFLFAEIELDSEFVQMKVIGKTFSLINFSCVPTTEFQRYLGRRLMDLEVSRNPSLDTPDQRPALIDTRQHKTIAFGSTQIDAEPRCGLLKQSGIQVGGAISSFIVSSALAQEAQSEPSSLTKDILGLRSSDGITRLEARARISKTLSAETVREGFTLIRKAAATNDSLLLDGLIGAWNDALSQTPVRAESFFQGTVNREDIRTIISLFGHPVTEVRNNATMLLANYGLMRIENTRELAGPLVEGAFSENAFTSINSLIVLREFWCNRRVDSAVQSAIDQVRPLAATARAGARSVLADINAKRCSPKG
jgi:hypothetical protein